MKVVEIAFVGYPVTDLKRAQRFYEEVLGLKMSRFFGENDAGDVGWIEYDLGPNTLSIGNAAPDWKAGPNGGSVALEVEDFPSAIAQLEAAGHKPFFGPFETPVCHMACVFDPDGNAITIHKRK
jgi:predicted enzyme related to lactoylglutathione lyase